MNDGVLQIGIAHAHGATHFTVQGEIDAVSAPILRAALAETYVERQVMVDMAGVRFMDSSGLSVLVGHALQVAANGGSMRICNASTAVRRLVEVTGLAELIYESEGA